MRLDAADRHAFLPESCGRNWDVSYFPVSNRAALSTIGTIVDTRDNVCNYILYQISAEPS